MANHEVEVNGTKFVPFQTGLKHPKLSWFIMMLNKYGIAHALIGHGMLGQILYVQQGTVELCNGIINQELARFNATTDNLDDGPVSEIRILINDLPNDHAFFESQIAGQKIDLESVVKADGVGEVFEVAKVDYNAVEEKALADLAEFKAVEVLDPITEEVDEVGPVIDVDATVLSDEVVTEDDEDDENEDDGWDFEDDEDDEVVGTYDEIEAMGREEGEAIADAVLGPTVKTKKAKSEPVEATDPDFETASEPTTDYAAVINGTEFLLADELLAFEDVALPDVKKPIRMYDVNSSTLSALGCKELSKDPLVVTMYVRFKSGGKYYRYNPVQKADYNTVLNEIVRKAQGIQEASAGSVFHHIIKVKGEEGQVKCQRLDDAGWVIVQPKSERTKDIKLRAKK